MTIYTPNTVALFDMEDAAQTAIYEYGPFGEPLRASGSFAEVNPFRFSTKYEDPETGWLYFGYRFYTPSTGRWASQDPIGEAGGINLRGFVSNDPANLVDPLGLVEWWNAWIPGQYSWEMAMTSFYAGDPVKGASYMSAYVGEVAFTLATFGYGSSAVQATRGATVCTQGAAKSVATPYGPAFQATTPEAQAILRQMQNGGTVYKGGFLGRSETGASQFLAAESPLNPGYAARYGIPPQNANFDFILTGRVQPGATLITRPAPPVPPNPGGAIEGVTTPGSFRIDSFYMPD